MRVIRQGEWFTPIDLKDADFHVPIAAHHQPFLRFAFRDRHYQFRVLPFGLSLSPRVFTRCVAAALAPLQAGDMKVLPYLDDWLVCAPSRAQVVQDTARLLTHVARLGLTVNVEKSCLVPTQRAAYLGLVLDSVAMRAYLSERRVDDILRLLLLFRRGERLPFVMYLRLLGKLTAASTAIPSGLLACSHPGALEDRAFLLGGAPLGAIPSFRETVTSDASRSGWGAVWRGRPAQGQWSVRDRACHINVLELRAVHLALRHFLPHLQGRHVLIRSDNKAVVSQINHQGGTKSVRLLSASRRLLTWAVPRLSSLRAVWLSGNQNRVADFLSRHKPSPGEWRLHPEVVGMVWGIFGRAEVDLFASRESTHCPLWFSWTEGDSPLGRDALGHEWPDSLLYAFPPLPLILPTLQRVLQQGHRLLLVAPFWPNVAFLPKVTQLLMAQSASAPCYLYLDNVMSSALKEGMIINRVQQRVISHRLFIQDIEKGCITKVIMAPYWVQRSR
ncbi:uncharacterized protein LOC125889006 [Epinephelus fuscoguttatus]|uniref:uncharacterized protein LOC125889006 n=1 Tax=Epinephelus fuscoguttatus TaxID=293821 RepID=UPI0020D1983F|nr:uncharacterized protein LOC125889006 [Epinephelus fuscoguttatus]